MTATRFVIDAPEKTNNGATLYMMIRVVDDSFAAESYQDAAAKVFGAERDKQILDSRPIFPGRERVTVPVEVGEKSDVAIYFFFTAPQGAWRQTLHHPLPAQIDVELGEHAIARVQPHKR
ncbi:MAG TPA: hypothetical protein VL242_30910 [Sorangium sp.]|nr:hypothetical protein [Sorangium sp.]